MTDPAYASMAQSEMRFIVGMSRAATTWLCKCLNEHSQACAFGESLFWGRRYLPPRHDGRYSSDQLEALRQQIRKGGSVYSFVGKGPGSLKHITLENFGPMVDAMFRSFSPAMPPTPGDTFAALSDLVASAEGKQYAVEKTPHHLMWIDRILEYVPQARFVIMVREPYGFMLSYKHFGDEKDDAMRARFRERYHPLSNALVWKSYMRAALAACTRYPDRTTMVRFEEIEQEPRQVLASVQQFLGLRVEDLAARVPADNTSFIARSRPELEGDDVFWMNLVAGRVVRAAGWELQSQCFAPWRVLWSILRLPWWAVANLLSFRRVLSGSVVTYLWRWLKPTGSVREGASRE